jgi:hypothetical protein
MTLFLLQWSYYFTRVEPGTVLAACRKASWDPEVPPLRDVITWLGATEVNPLGAMKVCGTVLPEVWKHGSFIHQRENVTRALMKALLGRKDGRLYVTAIKSKINDIFGLDLVNADLCERIIDGELRGETKTGLIVPDPSY